MSVKNRVGRKIDAVKLEIETNIDNYIEVIQSNNIKNMNTLEMQLSYITSNQPSISDQPHSDW